METSEIAEAVQNEDVYFLTDYFFNIKLTPGQIKIVHSLAFPENKRLVISCMTRYGKSFCVSIGVLFYCLFQNNKRVLLIAPTLDQTKIIRNYISQFIVESPLFRGMVDIALTGLDRLKSEVSKKRITFKNGNEILILSAEGTADRLMGFGGDLIVLDESCLISFEVYRGKISRMLGDNPDSFLVEIGNPWHRNNQMYEHWINPKFAKIHIDWKKAIKEGRLNEVFLEEQRDLLTPLEFKVLYEAEFPEEAEDSLLKYSDVEDAIKQDFKFTKPKKIISCDPADKGLDLTVIMWGTEENGYYKVEGIFSEPQSENMEIAEKIVEIYRTYGADDINIDPIGVGVGVLSRVRQLLRMEKVRVNACHYGEGVGSAGKEGKSYASSRIEDKRPESAKRRFMNRKAEQFFRMRELFEGGFVQIPKNPDLIKELMSMGWDKNKNTGKIKIIDPEKSPNYADALVYFLWKVESEVYISF